MTDRITNEDEFFRFLWDKSDSLRVYLESESYKNYLFPLIFYKFICDNYDDEYEEVLKRTNDPEYAALAVNHKFVIPKENHWRELRNVSTDIGMSIAINLKAIEKANSEISYTGEEGILDDIFGDVNWSNKKRLPDELLHKLIEDFSGSNLALNNLGEDILGRAYEYLLGQFAEDAGQTAQEFFTNRTLVTMMIEIMRPQNGDAIYDPTCGTGGMLTMSWKYAQKNGLDLRTFSFYGQEINELSTSVARMNLLINGIEDFKIKRGDVIERPMFVDGESTLQTFNIVMANPPYSIVDWNHERFEKDKYGRNMLGVPKKNEDFVFIQHILKSMNHENGRAAILLPLGILSSKAESELRKNLIESDLLDCVILVAKGLFFNSPMEACVFICRSKKDDNRKGKIKFINASKQFVKNGKHNDLSPENIKHITDLYFSEEDVEGESILVSKEKLLKGNYSLTVDSQLSRLEYPDIIDLEETVEDTKETGRAYCQSIRTLLGEGE